MGSLRINYPTDAQPEGLALLTDAAGSGRKCVTTSRKLQSCVTPEPNRGGRTTMMDYQRAKRISLKSHPVINERWLQQLITDDPSVLGIPGDPRFLSAERVQPHGGRLDLMLVDEQLRRRYEVEVQLGRTDPSHIIRTIEYWDHERTARPTWDHVAVLVAEEVTSRFSNVIRLFNSTIPIMAIQINAVQVGGHFTIAPTTVMDLTATAEDDDIDDERQATQPATREEWLHRTSEQSMALVDALHELVRQTIQDPDIDLKYNQAYVGLARHGRADNIVTFNPRKGAWVLTRFRTPRTEDLMVRLEEAGLDIATGYRPTRTVLRLTEEDLKEQSETIKDLIRLAADRPLSPDEDEVAG